MHHDDRGPPRQRQLDRFDRQVSPRLAFSILVMLAIIALTFALWPALNVGPQISDSTPVYRAPADGTAPPRPN